MISIVGLIGPFVQLSFSTSLSGPFNNSNIISYNNVPVGSVSLGNFANFSNIGDIVVNGKPVNSYEIAEINIYNTLKNPVELESKIDNITARLDPAFLESLSEPSLKEQLNSISPKYGTDLFNIVSSTGKVFMGFREALVSTGNIAKVSDSVTKQVANDIKTAEEYKAIANGIVFFLFVLVIISFVLFFIPKVSPKILRIILCFCLIFFVSLSIVVIYLNGYLNNYIQQIVANLNSEINSQLTILLNGLLEKNARLLSFFGGSNTTYIEFTSYLDLGWGAITAIIGLIATITSSVFIPKQNKDEIEI